MFPELRYAVKPYFAQDLLSKPYANIPKEQIVNYFYKLMFDNFLSLTIIFSFC